jgi:hypothetical protein
MRARFDLISSPPTILRPFLQGMGCAGVLDFENAGTRMFPTAAQDFGLLRDGASPEFFDIYVAALPRFVFPNAHGIAGVEARATLENDSGGDDAFRLLTDANPSERPPMR